MEYYKSETTKYGLVFKDMSDTIKSLGDLMKLTSIVRTIGDKSKIFGIFNSPIVIKCVNLINSFGSVTTGIDDSVNMCMLLRADEYYYGPIDSPNKLTLIKFLTDNENCLCNICFDDGKDHIVTCEKCQYQVCKECLIKCRFICPICKKSHIEGIKIN